MPTEHCSLRLRHPFSTLRKKHTGGRQVHISSQKSPGKKKKKHLFFLYSGATDSQVQYCAEQYVQLLTSIPRSSTISSPFSSSCPAMRRSVRSPVDISDLTPSPKAALVSHTIGAACSAVKIHSAEAHASEDTRAGSTEAQKTLLLLWTDPTTVFNSFTQQNENQRKITYIKCKIFNFMVDFRFWRGYFRVGVLPV